VSSVCAACGLLMSGGTTRLVCTVPARSGAASGNGCSMTAVNIGPGVTKRTVAGRSSHSNLRPKARFHAILRPPHRILRPTFVSVLRPPQESTSITQTCAHVMRGSLSGRRSFARCDRACSKMPIPQRTFLCRQVGVERTTQIGSASPTMPAPSETKSDGLTPSRPRHAQAADRFSPVNGLLTNAA
jgi:hypothetical protein